MTVAFFIGAKNNMANGKKNTVKIIQGEQVEQQPTTIRVKYAEQEPEPIRTIRVKYTESNK